MTLLYKVLGIVLIILAVMLLSLGLILNHTSACGPANVLSSNKNLMKAITHRCYGSPDVLKLEDIEKPTPADNEVLVKVHAASVNPLDWHFMRGTPTLARLQIGLGKPKDTRVGYDFAGTVEAVGINVKRFQSGDAVFGGTFGAFAEYVSVPEEGALVLKPTNLTFEQAASAPIAALTALQALRDKGQIQPGQRILINGASGGVGTFAVQIAKSLGADVTGVCSTRNVEMVRSIGADHVVDYTREDFTRSAQRYDLILDNVGNRSVLEYGRVLNPKGIIVIVGFESMTGVIKTMVLSPFVSHKVVSLQANVNRADLNIMRDLMQDGKVTPVIDRSYSLSDVPAAIGYLEKGHARGKVVITLEDRNLQAPPVAGQ
jgi:NADPH:quinone reductase-like Zn-dependent oxidoreductase